MAPDHENHREDGVRKRPETAGPTPCNAVPHAVNRRGSDTDLLDQDMQDSDRREGQDGPDGRPSPLTNADNPER